MDNNDTAKSKLQNKYDKQDAELDHDHSVALRDHLLNLALTPGYDLDLTDTNDPAIQELVEILNLDPPMSEEDALDSQWDLPDEYID